MSQKPQRRKPLSSRPVSSYQPQGSLGARIIGPPPSGHGRGVSGVVELDIQEQHGLQAAHPDPEAPGYASPDPASRSALWRAASTSHEMALYRTALLLPDQ